MFRSKCSLPLAIIGAVLFGSAMAQDKKAQTIEGWGEVIDPAGDCQIVEKKGRVVITVPGTQHNLNPTPEYDNCLAPRVLQEVEGDFQVRVKVFAFPMPEANTSTTKQGHSYVAAGLLVWQDDKTFIRCLRAALGEREEVFVHVEAFVNGKYPARGYQTLKDRRMQDKDVYVQAERRGEDFTFSRSVDGKDWEAVVRLTNLDLAKKVRVGVAAINSTKVEVSPQFAEFKLTGK
jgi:regulation of enolase protein 1 (concanavalin A-like superfamily)